MISRFMLVALAATSVVSVAHAQAGDGPKFTLTGDEAPKTQPWTAPAAFTYTKSGGEKSSLAIDAAGRIDWRLGDVTETTNTGFIRGVVHRNNKTGSQVESYAGEIGAHFEPSTAPKTPDAPPEAYDRAWYFYNDLSLGYSYKTNYDDEKDGCDATPTPVSCVRTHEGSGRLKWTVLPYYRAFEAVPAFVDGRPTDRSPALAYSFGPSFTVFTDQVLHAKVDAGTGVKPKGNVTGAAAKLSLALSPKAFGYRVVFRGSVQQTEAFSRATRREAGFPRSNTVGTISIDFELGARSFEPGPSWVPAFGISYTKGDDPLAGKLDQEETVIGIKLTRKNP